MRRFHGAASNSDRLLMGCFLLFLLTIGSVFARAQEKGKQQTFDATAMGTSTTMGKVVNVKIIIYEYSSEEDRQILIDAFTKGKNQGLVNALEKMKAVGRIAITGTLGYDLSFVRSIPTPNGRKIRFVTNRALRFGENYYTTRSVDYNLTAGELDLNDSDKNKSAGVLFPLARLKLDKEKQLTLDLNQNPWKLTNIIDWDKK